MVWFNKVSWSEGLFLRPQLFQQQERYLEQQAHLRCEPLGSLFWGFSALAIDPAALEGGSLQLLHARGVWPDGLAFDLPRMGPMPAPLRLEPAHAGQELLLALPACVAQAEDVSFEPEPPAGARYSVFDTELRDVNPFGSGPRSVQLLHMRARVASRLFERLHAGFAGGVVAAPGRTREARALPEGALIYEGLQPGQGLLPLRYNTLHAHNLLQEYFHASQCLYEFTLRGLGAALAGLDGSVVDLWLLLDDAPAELAAWLNADALALFATPVLNLFEGRTDRLRLAPERSEYHLVVDRTRPLDFEVWAVDELRGQPAGADTQICFRPLYQTLHRDGADHSRYFSMRREQRVLSAAARRCGTRSPYVGTEVYLSLVDQFDAPFRADLDQLSVRAWLTNRDLAMGMARPAPECRALGLQAGVAGAAMLRAPSPPAPALGLQHSAWSLIRLLGMHHLPLAELDAQSAAQALRELLGLFAQPADAAAARRIDGLLGARMHATTRRLPQPGPLVYGRTLECDLQVDDEAFAPASPLLFGMVLERLLGEYASINTCTSLRLHSAQRGPLWCSPARMGSRGIV